MKDKKFIIPIIVSVFLLIILSISGSRQKEVDWSPTFINTKTEPYGTYITYNQMKGIFDQPVTVTRKPIYSNLKPITSQYFYYNDDNDGRYDYYDEDEIELTDTMAYVFINTTFDLDKLDLQYLLDFVDIGNNVFISAESLGINLLDSLSISSDRKYRISPDTLYYLNNNPGKAYPIRPIRSEARLITDSCKFPVSVLSYDKNGQPVFVNVQYGKGNFYLHTVPNAFSNINQLDTGKYDYAYRCLSYLPRNNKVLWDEYQKQGAVGERSIFRVLLNNNALQASLYLTLIGMFLFMIFRAKRVQRMIPVLKPPVNSSVEFLDTVSNLYYRKKDFYTIVEKRHAYFLDYIRKNYYLSTETVNDDFLDALKAKSGMEKNRLKALFDTYNYLWVNSNNGFSNDSFLKYNSLLEEFYRNTKK